MNKESLERGVSSVRIETEELANLSNYFDKVEFAEAVDAVVAAKKVVTCASGTSGIAAKKFAHTLCCIEKSAQFMPPCEAIHGGLGALQTGDLLVIVSRGGKTAELLPVAAACAGRGARLLLVTENHASPLAAYADLFLTMKIGRESDKFNYMATSSFIVTVAMFDAVIAAVMEETGYRREQFAAIHPGGAVGKMLAEERNEKRF